MEQSQQQEDNILDLQDEKQLKLEDLTPEKRLEETIDSIYVTLNFTKKLKSDEGLRSLQMARAPDNYYSWTLEQRRNFLGASSVNALCKTIIMRNSEYNEQYSNDPFYPRFIMVIVQYSKKLVPQNIAAIMRQYQRDAYPNNKEKHIGRKFYKFRLAEEEDAYGLSGYKYNAITPFFMNDNSLKIILSDSIVNSLNPAYFWLGGGRVELKMGISVEEFLGYFGKDRVIVGNISTQ